MVRTGTFTVSTARIGAALAAVLLLAGGLATAASAQSAPFTAYGLGLEPGVVVEVIVNGKSCGTSTVNAAGEWGPIYAGTEQCPAASGDTITFTLDGKAADQTEKFVTGGAPADVQQGVSLTTPKEPEKADEEAEKPEKPSFDPLPASGIALVVSPGGTPEELRKAAAAAGCDATTIWMQNAHGTFFFYVFDAPLIVNQYFLGQYPSAVPKGAALLLMCGSALKT